jgi:hypothetical protein
MYGALAGLHPLGRVSQVSDIVDGILFLESSPFITGDPAHRRSPDRRPLTRNLRGPDVYGETMARVVDLHLDERPHDDCAVAGEPEVLGGVGGDAGRGDEEPLAPSGHSR